MRGNDDTPEHRCGPLASQNVSVVSVHGRRRKPHLSDEGDGPAGPTRSRCSANSVNIILAVTRNLHIDNEVDLENHTKHREGGRNNFGSRVESCHTDGKHYTDGDTMHHAPIIHTAGGLVLHLSLRQELPDTPVTKRMVSSPRQKQREH